MTAYTDRSGECIDQYRLIRLLGVGSFGTVYIGQHLEQGREVALKLFHARLTENDMEQLQQQVQIIAKLAHPNIIRICHIGLAQYVPYIAMDYAPNGTLRTRHPVGTRIPLRSIVTYVKQIARGLQYAHSQHILHRNLKPENILIGRYQELLLSDFTVFLPAFTGAPHSQSMSGRAAFYLAPEQLRGRPCPASDQYALAVLVYEWLCGQRPFQGTNTSIAYDHLHRLPASLQRHMPGFPMQIEQIVFKALSKDPEQRFPDIRSFATALEQAILHSKLSSGIYTLHGTVDRDYNQYDSQKMSAVRLPFKEVVEQPFKQDWAFLEELSTARFSPASVPPVLETPPLLSAAPVEKRQTPQRRISRRTALAAIVGLITVGSLAVYLTLQRSLGQKPKQAPVTKPTPVVEKTHYPRLALTYTSHNANINSIAWSPDEKYIASCSGDGTAQVWNADNGKQLLLYTNQQAGVLNSVYDVAWAPNSQWIAIGFNDGTAHIIDIASQQRIYLIDSHLAMQVYKLAWSPDGKALALALSNNSAYVYNVTTGRLISFFSGHTNKIRALAWSPDGQHIASGSNDTTIKIWDPLNGQEFLNYTKHTDIVTTVAWTSDNQYIASAGADRTVRIWQATTGQDTPMGFTHKATIRSVVWAANNLQIASGGDDGQTYIWDVRTGKPLLKIETGQVNRLAWSPDNKRLANGGASGKVQVWEIAQ